MTRSGILCFAFFAASTFVTEVYGIRCWDCRSPAAFCNDPFDESNVSENDKIWSYIECLPPSNTYDQRAVCKKVVHVVNDSPIITRSCFWENIYAPNTECVNDNAPSSVKTEFCETCDTDGCNGALQHSPIIAIIIISVIATRIALF